MRTTLPRGSRPLRSSFDHDDVLRISCEGCAMMHTSTCDDCIVTFLVDRDERAPERGQVTVGVSLDAAEADAVRMLQNAGLAPRLRHSAVLSLVGG